MNRQVAVQPVAKSSTLNGAVLQRKCACGQHTGGGECEECRKKKLGLQRRQGNGPETAGIPSIVHEVLSSPGSSLDPAARNFMESRFRQDFGRVQVHTDSRSAQSARSVNAQAYTVGQHVVFGEGWYKPTTKDGQWLLAHELAHVTQQKDSVLDLNTLSISPSNSPTEREANSIADRVIVESRSGPAIQAGPRLPALHRKQADGATENSAIPAGDTTASMNPISEFRKVWSPRIEEAKRILLEQKYGCFCGSGKVPGCKEPVNNIDKCCRNHDDDYDEAKVNTPDGVSMWTPEGLKRTVAADLRLYGCLLVTVINPFDRYNDAAVLYRSVAMFIFGELRPLMAAWCRVHDLWKD